MIIECPKHVNNLAGKEFKSFMGRWLQRKVVLFVIDFKGVLAVDPEAFEILTDFALSVNQIGKKLASINVPLPIYNKFKKANVASMFNALPNLADAKIMAGITDNEDSVLDVEFLKPFIQATTEVFKSRIGVPAKPSQPFTQLPSEKEAREFVVMMKVSSESFDGIVALCFQTKIILKVYEVMFAVRNTEINERVLDEITEVMRNIFGTAREILKETLGLELTTEDIIILRDNEVKEKFPMNTPSIEIPFNTKFGTFHLDIQRIVKEPKEK